MATPVTATNAASSGIALERGRLKALARRTDRHGLARLAGWAAALGTTGTLVWLTLDGWLVWPAMLLHGVVLCVPAYALSHETAHGTAFRTRWLNEAVLWLTSLVYLEEPLHRRYTHTNHHTLTWHVGRDSQMPFDTPMAFGGWLAEVSGLALLRFHVKTLWQLATGRYAPMLREVTPASELPRLTRNARVFVAVYAGVAALLVAGQSWLAWWLVLPRLLGAPAMLLFTLIQHVEMQENSPSILDSTRSFRTDRLGRWLYLNMNHHIEHHLYPQVPFHALPALGRELAERIPPPDPGWWRTNLEVLSVVIRRSLGRNTRARSIRQAPGMIGEGRYEPIARATMS